MDNNNKTNFANITPETKRALVEGERASKAWDQFIQFTEGKRESFVLFNASEDDRERRMIFSTRTAPFQARTETLIGGDWTNFGEYEFPNLQEAEKFIRYNAGVREFTVQEPEPSVFIHGQLSWQNSEVIKINLWKGKRTANIRLPIHQIKFEKTADDTALFELPKSFVMLFGLASFVLDDDEVKRYRTHVQVFNTPKAAPVTRTEKKPEKLGNIRF